MSNKKKHLSVGALIKEKRQAMECSQEAIATEIGVSIKFISLVENGERQLSVEHFPKIAQFLEIPLKELFNAKLFDEKTQTELRRIRKELIGGDSDQVGNAIRLNTLKELRSKEIDEMLKFLEVQRQDFIAQIKIGTIEKTRVDAQIKLLSEEKQALGFGQMQLSLEA
jgi:transcriptional regulator with XRE-family HTH domain